MIDCTLALGPTLNNQDGDLAFGYVQHDYDGLLFIFTMLSLRILKQGFLHKNNYK